MNIRTKYNILLFISIILTILAIITLIPSSSATKPNLLGYKSVCSFTPIGTIILCWLASFFCTIRSKLKDTNKKPIPLIIISIFFILGIFYYSLEYNNARKIFYKIINTTQMNKQFSLQKSNGEFYSKYSTELISANVKVTFKDSKITKIQLLDSKNAVEIYEKWAKKRNLPKK